MSLYHSYLLLLLYIIIQYIVKINNFAYRTRSHVYIKVEKKNISNKAHLICTPDLRLEDCLWWKICIKKARHILFECRIHVQRVSNKPTYSIRVWHGVCSHTCTIWDTWLLEKYMCFLGIKKTKIRTLIEKSTTEKEINQRINFVFYMPLKNWIKTERRKKK